MTNTPTSSNKKAVASSASKPAAFKSPRTSAKKMEAWRAKQEAIYGKDVFRQMESDQRRARRHKAVGRVLFSSPVGPSSQPSVPPTAAAVSVAAPQMPSAPLPSGNVQDWGRFPTQPTVAPTATAAPFSVPAAPLCSSLPPRPAPTPDQSPYRRMFASGESAKYNQPSPVKTPASTSSTVPAVVNLDDALECCDRFKVDFNMLNPTVLYVMQEEKVYYTSDIDSIRKLGQQEYDRAEAIGQREYERLQDASKARMSTRAYIKDLILATSPAVAGNNNHPLTTPSLRIPKQFSFIKR